MQKNAQDRRLHGIQAAVHTGDGNRSFAVSAVDPEPSQSDREFLIARNARPRVAERTEVLSRIEREAPDSSEGTGVTALDTKPVRVSTVLDHGKRPARGEFDEFRYRKRLAIQVYDEHGASSRRHRRGNRRRIDHKVPWIHIHVPRNRTDGADRRPDRDASVRHCQHLVPRLDANPSQSERKRIRTGGNADSVLRSGVPGEVSFEGCHFRPEHDGPRIEHPPDRFVDSASARMKRRPNVEEGNLACHAALQR